ncbi:M12 family metallopeptidase [Sinorhizobium medicae]|uniref:M12 family metallopeptidase n=1 Tax=Sinorhizobium medicae TaxID=110321 RepID=UPI0013E2CEBA|nr:M12 family metallopeptidase [Sinorhizobium medicae]
MRYMGGIFFVVLTLAASEGDAHDLEGEISQKEQIAKLPKAARTALSDREKFRDPEMQAAAVERALNVKRPASILEGAGEVPKTVPPTALEQVLEQVGDAQSRWQPGELLTVCFLDGSPAAQRRFLEIAAEMISLTNLALDTVPRRCGGTGAQIHVSFNDEGYYSYIGTDALFFDESVPTLNLSGMGGHASWSHEWVGVARHEIGHMLSLLHEHQHPDMNCGFKSDNEIAKMLGWNLGQVKTNFARITKRANLLKTHYDSDSVMHYQLDARFFRAGRDSPCFILTKNTTLSAGDVRFLEIAYPPF